MTPAQKLAHQRAQERLQATLAAGQIKVAALEVQDDSSSSPQQQQQEKKPKRVVYGKKKKNNNKENGSANAQAETTAIHVAAPPVAAKKESSSEAAAVVVPEIDAGKMNLLGYKDVSLPQTIDAILLVAQMVIEKAAGVKEVADEEDVKDSWDMESEEEDIKDNWDDSEPEGNG